MASYIGNKFTQQDSDKLVRKWEASMNDSCSQPVRGGGQAGAPPSCLPVFTANRRRWRRRLYD